MLSIEGANKARAAIKAVAADVLAMRHGSHRAQPEEIANVMLAYRHLEDASMRLGKAIQALDGGVSAYDKKTVVGA